VIEIREHPPSTLETSMAAPLGGDDEDLRVPTINVRNIDSGPQTPGGSVSIQDPKGVM
jgi:hypothetical protein